MELFIRNIPYSAREKDVQLAISSALHGGSYSDLSSTPINFDFRFHGKSNVSHKGNGALTLPSKTIGDAFLRRHGGKISVNGRLVYITISRHPARPNVVQRLLSSPYQDPRSEAAQQIAARAEDLAKRIRILGFHQGWMHRDGSFFSEYSLSTADNRKVRAMSMRIDDEGRNILLDIDINTEIQPTFGILSLIEELMEDWSTNYLIKFHYSSIYRITFGERQDHSEKLILFQLKSPVSYEQCNGMGSILSMLGSANAPQRQRLSSLTFDPRHESLANTISKTVLVRCAYDDAMEFKRLCKLAQIGHIRTGPIDMALSTLLSGLETRSLLNWIKGKKWEVAFQLQRILSNMLLNPEELRSIQTAIDDLVNTLPTSEVCAILQDFIARLEVIERGEEWEDEPPSISECLQRATIRVRHPVVNLPRLRKARGDKSSGEFPCLHVVVTPTRLILEGPAPEQLNRVLRMYPNHWRNFLRVRFADEDQNQFRWERGVNGAAFVRMRVGGILKRGLTIAGRHFEYLGYSNSSLKSHTVWFVRPFVDPKHGLQDANAIIARIGDFSRDIQCPARMGARIAQAFSSTDLSITATAQELIKIPDIKRNGSCFTDGVGTISTELAEQIWDSLAKLRKKRSYFLPAAYQVRLGGYKGMLAIDYRLEGSVVCVRDSMDKFSSPSLDIEVSQAFERPAQCFLNRPLIMILDTANQVPASAFLHLQLMAVREARAAMKEFYSAARMLETHGLGTAYKIPQLLLRLLGLGMDPEQCTALGLSTVLKDAETDVLRDLKHRARIPVPGSWKLVGIADEFDYLEEGQVYACVHDRDNEAIYLKGPFIITRSPVIHPGDIQVVTAIGKPPPGTPFDRQPLKNTVVLPCRGDRSLASCLGGGDLDGDTYDLINLTSCPELTPQAVYPPAAYPPATKNFIQGRRATIDDVKQFICDYINSDILGVVATRHLKLADIKDLGVNDPDCLKLAELHSQAVDFQKSGTPVNYKELPPDSMLQPDWNAGEVQGRRKRDQDSVYASPRALGQLYRNIQLDEDQLQIKGTHPNPGFGMELEVQVHARPLDRSKYDAITYRVREVLSRHIPVDQLSPAYFSEAVTLLEEYITELARICNDYALSARSMLSEEEVVAGTILERTSQRRRRQDMISEMRTASTTLGGNVRDVLRGSDSDRLVDWASRSWAAYQVARSSERFGHNSFGLLALSNAFEAIEAINQEKRGRAGRFH